MQSLAKAFGRSANTGRPLPEVYRSFTHSKIAFRLSATSMIAGAPGAFKSALAINLLVGWARQGCYGLYFSADADEFTTAKRVAAVLTKDTVEHVEAGLRGDQAEDYKTVLGEVDHTRWIYKAADIDEIDRHMRAFEAVYGVFPQVVFVDNLLNMTGGGEGGNEWEEARTFIKNLDVLAREAECHVCVLHHCSESEWRKGMPPPRSAVMGKIAQFPRLMLTVAPSAEGMTLNVAVVKNTNGPQDPSGDTFTGLNLDPSRMLITDSGLFTGDGFFESHSN